MDADRPWPTKALFDLSSKDKETDDFSVWDSERTTHAEACQWRVLDTDARSVDMWAFDIPWDGILEVANDFGLPMHADRTPRASLPGGPGGGDGHCSIRGMPHSGQRRPPDVSKRDYKNVTKQFKAALVRLLSTKQPPPEVVKAPAA